MFHSDTDTDIPVPLAAVRWILFFICTPRLTPCDLPKHNFLSLLRFEVGGSINSKGVTCCACSRFPAAYSAPPSKPVKLLLIQRGHIGLEFYWTLQPHKVTPGRITFRILPHQLQTPSTTKYNQVKTINIKYLSIFVQ